MLDVLLIEDDDFVRETVAEALVEAGHRVTTASDGERAASLISTCAFDVAICDVALPRIDGMTIVRQLRREAPATAVVVMTAFGQVSDAIEVFRAGASEYVTKPFDPQEFTRNVIGRISDRMALVREFGTHGERRVRQIVARSLPMQRSLDNLELLAQGEAAVLIRGELGTETDLVARTLHAKSTRRDGPLVAVDCASLSAHEDDRWFRAAESGTLLLLEVGALGDADQIRLLRLMEQRALQPRSRGGWRALGVRVLSVATEPLVLDHLLEPLLFRLRVGQLRVPPLREREADIPLLARQHLDALTPTGKAAPTLTPRALAALSLHTFVRNVDELETMMEDAIARAGSGAQEIDLEHLPEALR